MLFVVQVREPQWQFLLECFLEFLRVSFLTKTRYGVPPKRSFHSLRLRVRRFHVYRDGSVKLSEERLCRSQSKKKEIETLDATRSKWHHYFEQGPYY